MKKHLNRFYNNVMYITRIVNGLDASNVDDFMFVFYFSHKLDNNGYVNCVNDIVKNFEQTADTTAFMMMDSSKFCVMPFDKITSLLLLSKVRSHQLELIYLHIIFR